MTIQKYAGDKITGLSTDTKPTNVLDGATFYATDTKEIYVKVGGVWGKWSSDWLSDETIADAGSAYEIDGSKKTHHITFTENCALTFDNFTKNEKVTIVYSNASGYSITLPVGTYAVGSSTPVLGAYGYMVIGYDGSKYSVMATDFEEIT